MIQENERRPISSIVHTAGGDTWSYECKVHVSMIMCVCFCQPGGRTGKQVDWRWSTPQLYCREVSSASRCSGNNFPRMMAKDPLVWMDQGLFPSLLNKRHRINTPRLKEILWSLAEALWGSKMWCIYTEFGDIILLLVLLAFRNKSICPAFSLFPDCNWLGQVSEQ